MAFSIFVASFLLFSRVVSLPPQLQNEKFLQYTPNREIYMQNPHIVQDSYEIPLNPQTAINNPIENNFYRKSLNDIKYKPPKELSQYPLAANEQIKLNLQAIPINDLEILKNQAKLLKHKSESSKITPLTELEQHNNKQILYQNAYETTQRQINQKINYEHQLQNSYDSRQFEQRSTKGSNQVVNAEILSKLVSNPKFRNIVDSIPKNKRYTVINSDGTVEYITQFDEVAKKYPRHVVVNSRDITKYLQENKDISQNLNFPNVNAYQGMSLNNRETGQQNGNTNTISGKDKNIPATKSSDSDITNNLLQNQSSNRYGTKTISVDDSLGNKQYESIVTPKQTNSEQVALGTTPYSINLARKVDSKSSIENINYLNHNTNPFTAMNLQKNEENSHEKNEINIRNSLSTTDKLQNLPTDLGKKTKIDSNKNLDILLNQSPVLKETINHIKSDTTKQTTDSISLINTNNVSSNLQDIIVEEPKSNVSKKYNGSKTLTVTENITSDSIRRVNEERSNKNHNVHKEEIVDKNVISHGLESVGPKTDLISNNDKTTIIMNVVNRQEKNAQVNDISDRSEHFTKHNYSKDIASNNESHINSTTLNNKNKNGVNQTQENTDQAVTIKSIPWDSVATENEVDGFFCVFLAPPKPKVEKNTFTTIYPNGTVLEEVIETIGDEDGGPSVTTTTRIVYPNGIHYNYH